MGLAAPAYYPSTWEAETGSCKFEANLGYTVNPRQPGLQYIAVLKRDDNNNKAQHSGAQHSGAQHSGAHL